MENVLLGDDDELTSCPAGELDNENTFGGCDDYDKKFIKISKEITE